MKQAIRYMLRDAGSAILFTKHKIIKHSPAVLQYGIGAILIALGILLMSISPLTSCFALLVGFALIRLDAIRFRLNRSARERELTQIEYASNDSSFAQKYLDKATSFERSRYGTIDTLTDPRQLAPANALVVSKVPERRKNTLGELIDKLWAHAQPTTITIILILFIIFYTAAIKQ